MSEFHPNRTKPVRTKPGLTARRIVECWPLLVWVGVAVGAFLIYRSGAVFVRMNGAVDVYQENITPVNDGRLLEIKVKRGAKVAPGTVLAIMDPSHYRLELESLKRDLVFHRTKDIRDYDIEILKLEGDMRSSQTQDAEDSAIIKELERVLEEFAKPVPGRSPALQHALETSPDTQRSRTEMAKAKGRNSLNAMQQSEIKAGIDRTKAFRDSLAKEAAIIEKLDFAKIAEESLQRAHEAGGKSGGAVALDTFSDEVTKSGGLRADEQQKYIELKTRIDQCQLITPHGGTVDRVGKELGEYVKAGEGVLKIVGDPDQIVCFLPQDQADDLRINDKVWVTSSAGQNPIPFQSVVTGIAPRINNLPDATSPLPHQRVHGRDVIVKYPPQAVKDGKFLLLPGQTLIIYTKEPGHENWLDAVFHNDDNDKSN